MLSASQAPSASKACEKTLNLVMPDTPFGCIGHGLVSGDPRSLDDRPPSLDLCALVGAERLRGELIGRWNDLAELDEVLAYGRVMQGIYNRRVEPADVIVGRAFGRPDRIP